MRRYEKAGAFVLGVMALVGVLATCWSMSDAQVPPSPSAMSRNDPVANETIRLKGHTIRPSDGGTYPHVFTSPGRIGYDTERECITLFTGDGGWRRVCPSATTADGGVVADEWTHYVTDGPVLFPTRGQTEDVAIGTVAATWPVSKLDVRSTNANVWDDNVCSSAEACPTPSNWSNPPYLLTLTNTQSSGGGDAAILLRMTGDPLNYYTSAAIGVTASSTGAWGAGTAAGRLADLYFVTRGPGDQLIERMRIYGNGYGTKVAIGVNGGSAGGSTLSVRGSFAVGNTYYATASVPTGTAIFEGSIGVGNTSPAVTGVDVTGQIIAYPSGTTPVTTYGSRVTTTRASASAQHYSLCRAGNSCWSLGTAYDSDTFGIGRAQASDADFDGTDLRLTIAGTTDTRVALAGSAGTGTITLTADTVVTSDELNAIGPVDFDSTLLVGGVTSHMADSGWLNTGTATGTRWYEPSGSGSNYTRLIAQAQGADVTYTLPAAQATAAGQCMKNDGSGTLSWGACAGGGGSGVTVDPAIEHVGNVSFFTDATEISGEDELHWDATNNRLSINAGTSPVTTFDVLSADVFGMYFRAANASVASGNGNLLVFTSDSHAADVGGSIALGGNSVGTGVGVPFGYIWGRKANGTSGNELGYLAFGTRSAGAANERMRIDSSGHVSIGTTSASDRLDVHYALDGSSGIRARNTSTGSSAYTTMYLGSSSGSTDAVFFHVGTGNSAYGGARSAGIGTNVATPFVFITNSTEVGRWSGANFGIGDTSPAAMLTVGSGDLFQVNSSGAIAATTGITSSGGIRLSTATAKPTCDSSVRGLFWVEQGGAGVKDNVEVCAKAADDSYGWRTIY